MQYGLRPFPALDHRPHVLQHHRGRSHPGSPGGYRKPLRDRIVSSCPNPGLTMPQPPTQQFLMRTFGTTLLAAAAVNILVVGVTSPCPVRWRQAGGRVGRDSYRHAGPHR